MNTFMLLQASPHVAEKSAEMLAKDPHGAIITLVSVSVVFFALIILYYAYTFIGKLSSGEIKLTLPKRKPGTSTRVTRGMLKASQKRTNRAALRDALISSTPARIFGWFATIPTERPFMCAKPTMMFLAHDL